MEFLDFFSSFTAGTFMFIFGVIIGSFLNVFIYRFHTGKSLSGSSHCLSCATTLRWCELFPLFSYLFLRGRCRTCSSRIPSRYFLVELMTGLLFLSVFFLVESLLLWPLTLFMMALLVVIVVYDIDHMVIPDSFVLTLIGVALIHAGFKFYFGATLLDFVFSLGSALIAFSFFAGLWFVSGGRWIGFGDSKLAIPLGFMVGIGGVFSMLVLSFWIGTVISLGLISFQKLRQRGQPHLRFITAPLTIKSEVPFAPFLILGFLTVFLLGVDVLQIFNYAF